MKIRVIITGRSYHTASALPDELILPDAATVDVALAELVERSGDREPLPDSCLLAVSGQHLGTLASHPDRPLRDGDELTLIAPVAGG